MQNLTTHAPNDALLITPEASTDAALRTQFPWYIGGERQALPVFAFQSLPSLEGWVKQQQRDDRSGTHRYLVMDLGAHRQISDPSAASIAALTAEILALVQAQLSSVTRQRLEALAQALAPSPDPVKVRKIQMTQNTKSLVYGSTTWLTASQITELGGYSASNPSARPSTWKRQGRLFALQNDEGLDIFPLYGLNPDKRYSPLPEMKHVLALLQSQLSPLAIAAWFAAANAYLGDRRPLDVLAAEPGLVLQAAERSMVPLDHG